MATSIKNKQIGALKQMLNFNQPISKATVAEPVWKILVYDRYGQDIISPLLSVKELQELGVTLHMQLHSQRDPIPDVPAIYFCVPSEENLGRIGQDMQAGLYDAYHFNFISPITRQRLEELASSALNASAVPEIRKVYDQYINFISLEDDLFTLRCQNSDIISYYSMNRGDVKDTEMDQILDIVVDSLFSVFATLGTVPIIRCSKNNAAEMAAEKLDKKLRENLRDTRSSLFTADSHSGQLSFQRPLLVLLDRNLDMATPLHHTWTYQALTHEVLDLSLNRVTVKEGEDEDKAAGHHRTPVKHKTRTCDLDDRDKFWVQYKGSPFPIVAESIQEELEEYKASEGEVKRLKESMGLGDESDAAVGALSNTTAKLTSAVSSLPQLLEKKRLIDMHTTIATAVLEQIKHRKLDVFFEIEEKVMSRTALDKSLMDILSDPECGTPEDKMRLFLIYYMCDASNISEPELEQYSTALRNAGCNLAPLRYMKRWKAYTRMAAASNQYVGGGTKTVGMFAKLMSQGSSFVMEGVKNLVVKKHNLPVTRIMDQLMELKQGPETEDYRYFDPKLLRSNDGSIPRSRAAFQEAVVFVVGGGNYVEYQNLVDYAKSKTANGTPKRVIYGCSSLFNGDQFLKQLALLGEEME